MTVETRKIAYEIDFDIVKEGVSRSPTIAIGNMDGSWWVDWDRLHEMREHESGWPEDQQAKSTMMLLDLLLMARGNGLREVTRERADQIALEYGNHVA